MEAHPQGTERISHLVRYHTELLVHALFGGCQGFCRLALRARSLCSVLRAALDDSGKSDVPDVLQQGGIDRQAIGPAALLVDHAHGFIHVLHQETLRIVARAVSTVTYVVHPLSHSQCRAQRRGPRLCVEHRRVGTLEQDFRIVAVVWNTPIPMLTVICRSCPSMC
jgi:hypothetical protein